MADPGHIRAWQRLDARTTTSGSLVGDDVAQLAALGVTRVINLALADHPDALADEPFQLAAHAIAYTHIPVPWTTPTQGHYLAFCAAYDASAPAPVHVHCVANWRVSAFFYRYNRERGMAEAEARALMARQWEPETSSYPAADAWVRFIAESRR